MDTESSCPPRRGQPFPPLTEWARVSIGTEKEMQTFLSVFESIMREYGKVVVVE